MASDAEARIWGVIGASGTGKGLWTKQQLRTLRPTRLVIWDFKAEYGEFAQLVPSLQAMRDAIVKAGDSGPLAVRYVPRGAGEKAMRKEFEAVCELVYAAEHCTFIAEELANVTTPGWAPASWRKMTTSGRHACIHIIGATQTPALVDKTFLGNCTLIHCCALREYGHRVAVARSMDIDEAQIGALVKFEFIEKDFDTGTVSRGFVTVPGQKGGPKAPSARGASATGRGAANAGQRPQATTKVAASQPAPARGTKPAKEQRR